MGVTEFWHTASSIAVTHPRLGAPWARTVVVLENSGSLLQVRVSALRARALRHALRASGLIVHEATGRLAPQTQTR